MPRVICHNCGRLFKRSQYFIQHLSYNTLCRRRHDSDQTVRMNRSSDENVDPNPSARSRRRLNPEEEAESDADGIPIDVPAFFANNEVRPMGCFDAHAPPEAQDVFIVANPDDQRPDRDAGVRREVAEPRVASDSSESSSDLASVDGYEAGVENLPEPHDGESLESSAELSCQFGESGSPASESSSMHAHQTDPADASVNHHADAADSSVNRDDDHLNVKDQFTEYMKHGQQKYRALDPNLVAAIELLDIMNQKGIAIKLYRVLMDWHFRHLNVQKKVTVPKLLKKLRKRYNMEDTLPHQVQVVLPSSGAKVKIPCHNWLAMTRDLLTDPRITDDDYLFFEGNPIQGPPEDFSVVGDLNTGLAYRSTYDQLIRPNPVTDCGRNKFLLPVLFYQDGTATGSLTNMSMELVKFTLGCFNYEAREKDHLWRVLGAVPKYDPTNRRAVEHIAHSEHAQANDYITESDSEDSKKLRKFSKPFEFEQHIDSDIDSSDSEDEMLKLSVPETDPQDFHQTLKVILASHKEVADKGGFPWDLWHRGTKHELWMIPFVACIKGDTVEHDKHCGKHQGRGKGVKVLCRQCLCPTLDSDKPHLSHPKKTPQMIIDLVKKRDLKGLQGISQQMIFNAWYEIGFGLHNQLGVHGACPMEIIHWINLGMMKYDREMFYEQTGKESKLSEKFNGLAVAIGHLHRRQSCREFPRTKFSRGIQAGGMMAHEMSGVLLVLATTLRTTRGRAMLIQESLGQQRMHFPDVRCVADWIMLLESHLQFEQWLKRKTMSVALVKRADLKVREMMQMTKVIGQRQGGMGLRTNNFHATKHVFEDILNFGVPANVNTKSNEKHHKPDKKSAKRTQMRPGTFDLQVCNKVEDRRVVELAASETIGHRRWAHQAGFQSTKESSSLKKAARSEILTGVRTEVWCDETEAEHQWLIHTEMKRKDKFKHLSFVKEKVNDLCFMLSEWIEPNKLQFCTELRLDGKLHRASPHCQGKPWCDWAMFLFPKNEDDERDQGNSAEDMEEVPCQIRGFIDLRFLPRNNHYEINPGIVCLVEAARHSNDPDEQGFGVLHEAIVKDPWPDNPFGAPNRMFVVHSQRLVRPACVVPDLDNKNSRAYIQVLPLEEWVSTFEDWISQEHTQEFNKPQSYSPRKC